MDIIAKKCVLEEKVCTECGACNVCDLDETKICDNCCKCLGDAEYTGVEIDEVLFTVEELGKKRDGLKH